MNNLNLAVAYPEIFVAVATCVILLIDMFLDEARRNITYGLSLLTLAIAALLTCANMGAATEYAFNDMFVSDALSDLLKLFCYLALGLTFIYSRQYMNARGLLGGLLGGEFYTLSLFSLLGQMIMISGNSLLTIYLGLELMSLPIYALVALRRDHIPATEAAMKYFVLGALASGFLLYGMSMLYGATGTLILSDLGQAIAAGSEYRMVLLMGLVFVVSGLAFKLGAAPYHMWVPDVYQGAPTSITLILGAAPKLAAFAIVFRLLVEGLGALAIDWQQMLIVLSVLSLAVGNITAIAQTNIKRMLAYSTISHTGFMLLGFLGGVYDGSGIDAATNAYSSALFYIIIYVLTTLGSFGVIMLLSRAGFEAENLEDFKGLNQRSPWFAAVMLILMLSLAGVPPLVGFYAKLAVLQAVLQAGHLWLVVVAVLFSLVGAYYYLRVARLMYFESPVDTARIEVKPDMRIALSANGAALLLLGVAPGPLMTLCVTVMSRTLIS